MSTSVASGGRSLADALSILAPSTGTVGGDPPRLKRRKKIEGSEEIAQLLPIILRKRRRTDRPDASESDDESGSDVDGRVSVEEEDGEDSARTAGGAGKGVLSEGKKKKGDGDGEGEGANDSKKKKVSGSHTPPDFGDSDEAGVRNRLEARLERLRNENERLLCRRMDAAVRHRDFLSLYEYGLDKISRLNDLRDAPDAIMPGNFPDEH